ncbi:hypothetical protein [Candidatus Odyssella thessalonicensis]|uniref:hypothetical protein n=1 Tax=Candidatus Odyssella thessalonicensis TaxID=84647 RepID=UPI000317BB9A|nr:hypothetical protein [Candidatus Odyssella thessalonicensis]
MSQISNVRTIFSIEIGQYKNKSSAQRFTFSAAQPIQLEAALQLFASKVDSSSLHLAAIS